MDDKSFTVRVPRRWVRIAMIVGVTALIVAPLTAVAIDRFTDVPNDNTFHDDITAIADAGVTLGCNPPDNDEYCPEDFVTREQMAAFMNRLGALGPGETPVVNAAELAGLTPDKVASGFADSGPTGNLESVSGVQKLEEINVDTPADGYLQISGLASFGKSAESTTLLWLQVDNTACDNGGASVGSVGFGYANTAGANARLGSASAEGTVAVTEGIHTITLCGNVFLGAPANLVGPSISALFLSEATVTVGIHSGDAGDIPGTE